MGYTNSWYEWKVDCGQNCTDPFLLRAVDSAGSDSDKQHGGFYSYQFWIQPLDTASSSTTKIPLSTITTNASPTSSLTVLSSSTSYAAVISRSSSVPATTTAEVASSTSSQGDNNGSSHVGTLVGVGVGVGVAATLLLLGGFFLYHRYMRRTKAKHAHPPVYEIQQQGLWQAPLEADSLRCQSRAAELDSSSKMVAPVEVPSRQMDPQELSADTVCR